MKCRFIVLVLWIFPLALQGQLQDNDRDGRLLDLVSSRGQSDVSIDRPGSREMDFIARNFSVLDVKDNKVIISISPRTAELFISRKYNYFIVQKPVTRDILSAPGTQEAAEWDVYPTYTQYVDLMNGFASAYPSLCKLDTIGTSVNGKLVLALKISDNVTADEDEPEVFYTSTMHGDETGGFILMLHLADHILRNYSSSPGIKDLADNLEIWINPLANPDGTYRNGSTIDNTSTRYNANGYDLNRNFPDRATPYSSTNVQQKETADMISFMRRRRFVLSANFHSGAEVVNYPWDKWLYLHHADETWFHDISRAYADTVHKYSGPGYLADWENGVVRGAVWYVVYGGRQDFVTGELQGREVTIELDYSFITPQSQLLQLWNYNYRSLLGYLENALYGIHGKVSDKLTAEPVPARIYIAGHDRDSSQVYSDSTTGSFVRMLSPGSWDITFSAKGYRDTIVTNVTILQRQRTDLNVAMTPVSSTIDTTLPPVAVLYPNPAIGTVYASLDARFEGSVNIRIYSQSGAMVSGYNEIFYPGTPLKLRTNGFAQGAYTAVFTVRQGKLMTKGRFVIIKN